MQVTGSSCSPASSLLQVFLRKQSSTVIVARWPAVTVFFISREISNSEDRVELEIIPDTLERQR